MCGLVQIHQTLANCWVYRGHSVMSKKPHVVVLSVTNWHSHQLVKTAWQLKHRSVIIFVVELASFNTERFSVCQRWLVVTYNPAWCDICHHGLNHGTVTQFLSVWNNMFWQTTAEVFYTVIILGCYFLLFFCCCCWLVFLFLFLFFEEVTISL